jgi:hypothetical protein
MGSEDFSRLPRAGVPSLMMRIGATDPATVEKAEQTGATLPSLHSPFFAPVREPALKAAITAEVLALRELMPARAGPPAR